MKMPNWLRKVPHPHHGKWCGGKNTHPLKNAPEPVDDLDAACMLHDFKLQDTQNEEDRRIADMELRESAKKSKPKTLYGKLYRLGVMVVFR